MMNYYIELFFMENSTNNKWIKLIKDFLKYKYSRK